MAEGHREDASVDDEGGAGDTDGRSWAPSGAEVLRERWFACSSALGWASPAEWPHPTVDRVCAAICARGDGTAVEKALARWAGARAGAGVGLAETLSDLAALHTAVSGVLRGGEPTDGVPRLALATDAGPSPRQAGDARPNGGRRGLDGARLLRAVALAWTDVACGDLAETAAVDPLSGLASVRYLRTRLAEVYRAARARGRRVPDEHALVVITLTVHGWTRVAPLSLAGEAIGVVFDAGESVAVVGRATIVVLAPREDLAERTRVLRRLLARRLPPEVGVSRAPSVRIVGLPATHDGACAVLERLRDDDRGPRTPTAGA